MRRNRNINANALYPKANAMIDAQHPIIAILLTTFNARLFSEKTRKSIKDMKTVRPMITATAGYPNTQARTVAITAPGVVIAKIFVSECIVIVLSQSITG